MSLKSALFKRVNKIERFAAPLNAEPLCIRVVPHDPAAAAAIKSASDGSRTVERRDGEPLDTFLSRLDAPGGLSVWVCS